MTCEDEADLRAPSRALRLGGLLRKARNRVLGKNLTWFPQAAGRRVRQRQAASVQFAAPEINRCQFVTRRPYVQPNRLGEAFHALFGVQHKMAWRIQTHQVSAVL